MRLLVLFGFLAGCARSVTGLYQPDPAAVREMDGDVVRLRVGRANQPMLRLDGHLVEVDGGMWFGRLAVRRWRVLEGRGGLPAWVGRLARHDRVPGLEELDGDGFFRLDPASFARLVDHEGDVVLVEGYGSGDDVITVVYFRVLETAEER
jgi:hypothetical protein